jgi:hypothetical protein
LALAFRAIMNQYIFMRNIMRRAISISFCFLLILILSAIGSYGSVLSDPKIPDGEQIVWQVTKEGRNTTPSVITWKTGNINGKPVYQVTTDSGKRKYASYTIDRSDMRLLEAQVSRDSKNGKSQVTIRVENSCQYLVSREENKKPKKKEIECSMDGYDGAALPFSLRGFPFETQKEIEMRITPPFKPGMPMWAWRMWESYAKLLGTEKVNVPAGTFDCYKLEVGASGGLIKHLTSNYYFWFTKESPHQFVKYQDEDGENVTELIEIRSNGE